VVELERDRVDAYAELRTEVRQVQGISSQLRSETSQLVAALRAPQVRGRWGEHQLRRIVEAAGMLEHCDFDEQVSAGTDNGGIRPDLVVRLSGDRRIVVDAKAPFDAYLTTARASTTWLGTHERCAGTSTRSQPNNIGPDSRRRQSSPCSSCRLIHSSTPRYNTIRL
jgi:DNA anti-recombination protein RmuC